MRTSTTIFLSAVILLAFVSVAPLLGQQQEVELTPSKDNTLYESATGALSNGSGSFLFFGLTNQAQGATRRAVIAFDVASEIPAGSVIESAVLQITVTKTTSGAGNTTVHRVLQDWGEGASVAPGSEGAGTASAENDATWIHAFFDTEEWQTIGGNYDAGTLTSASVGALGAVEYPSTAEFVGAVQSWLDTPDQNFGLIIIGDEESKPSSKQIGSKDGTAANQPRLIVTYSVATAAEDAELPRFLTTLNTYPNPLTDNANIAYELAESREVRIDVVDVTGRIVATPVEGILQAGPHTARLDVRDLTPGLYLVRLVSGGESATRTIIVQ